MAARAGTWGRSASRVPAVRLAGVGSVPRVIEKVVGHYLDAVDRERPGLVTGLYLVGSVALGAWQPGASDIDAVILTSRVPAAGDLAALETVHGGMPASPHFDGVYLDPELLRSAPVSPTVTPFVVDGGLRVGKPCGELNPVLWLTLLRHGRRVRGPEIADLGIRVAPEALRDYNLGNLRSYWQPLVRSRPPDLPDEQVPADFVAWLTLGPARLHHTLAYGDIISKAAAGAYLAELFPAYAELAGRAVAHRAGTPQQFSAADLRAAAASVDAVAEDAWSRFGPT